jgi:prefoldin subunit 5
MSYENYESIQDNIYRIAALEAKIQDLESTLWSLQRKIDDFDRAIESIEQELEVRKLLKSWLDKEDFIE